MTLIRNELISNGVVTDVTRTSQPMTQHWSDTWGFNGRVQQPDDLKTDFTYFASDEGFVRTLGLKLVSGRDMNTHIYPTDSNAMLLNESSRENDALERSDRRDSQVDGSSLACGGCG